MTNEEKKAISDRVIANLEKVKQFENNRVNLSPLQSRMIIGEIKAETIQIYIHAYIQSKGDVEDAFEYCYSSMIQLQFKTISFLTL